MSNYMVFNNDKEYDYDITVEETDEGTVYSLIRSNSGEWSEHAKGKLVLSITNTGDNYIINPKLGKDLDYSVASELYLLLRFIDGQSKHGLYRGEILKYEIVKFI